MHESGIPTMWWLWWFVVSAVVYAVLIVWFMRHRRHDREAWESDAAAHTTPGDGG